MNKKRNDECPKCTNGFKSIKERRNDIRRSGTVLFIPSLFKFGFQSVSQQYALIRKQLGIGSISGNSGGNGGDKFFYFIETYLLFQHGHIFEIFYSVAHRVKDRRNRVFRRSTRAVRRPKYFRPSS